jgi:hypothetical protein
MSDLETHATLIRKAIRETTEAMMRTTERKEHTVLLAHLQCLQRLEGAVLSMVSFEAKGEKQ